MFYQLHQQASLINFSSTSFNKHNVTGRTISNIRYQKRLNEIVVKVLCYAGSYQINVMI